MRNIFKVKREERWPSLVALLLFISLNSLLIYKYGKLFLKAHHVSYWQLFGRTFHVSGFDDWSYCFLSNDKLYFDILRHPLYAVVLYPFNALNQWLMDNGDVNYAMPFMALLLVVTAYYAFIFLYRIFREVIGVGRKDTLLLSAFFYSFGMIMVTVMVPDHFCLSLFLLTMTLYLAGMAMREKRRLSPWLVTLLGFITGGLSLSNFAKTYIAAWFANGRRIFNWRYVTLGIASLALLVVTAHLLQTEVRDPQKLEEQRMAAKQYPKDPERARTDSLHHAMVLTHQGEHVADSGLGLYTNLSISRSDALVHNMFGESIQLHDEWLLADMFNNRPEVVKYRYAFNYAVEGAVVLLFLLGIIVGARHKFFLMALSCFAVDVVLHLVLGFGLDEVYIMSAHWIFIIPISLAYVLRYIGGRCQCAVRLSVLALTLYLWAWNGWLLLSFMTDRVTEPLKYFS